MAGPTGEPRPVVSARLDGSARPRNRLFPKTRSWFALDSPLELLSPISVLRVLFALATLAWSGIGLTAGLSDRHRVVVATVCAATAVLWIVLLRLRKVGATGCRLLAGYWTVAAAVLIWCADGSVVAILFALSLAPMAVCGALFFGPRVVTVDLVGTAVLVGVALGPSQGPARGTALALGGTLMLSAAPLTVLLLSRAARRHDTVDPDTGLVNGFGIAQLVTARHQSTYLVAAVSLEGIGHAREALGYQVGTELLRRAVEDLGQVLPSEATIGRVDGDELVVTLGLDDRAPGPTGPAGGGDPQPPTVVDQAGQELAEVLIRAIGAGRYLVGSIEVPLGAHVGIAAAPWDGTEVAELVRRASLSARRAADRGVPMVHWDGDQGALTAADLELLADLRLSPARGQLSLAYQPQVSAETGAVEAVEALVRWDHPVLGPVSPGQFIPLAERTGVIDELTGWVLGEALDAQRRWRRARVDLPVSVNLSAKSLAAVGLPGRILSELAVRDLPTSCLTVEVTETAVADPDQALAVLRPLHQAGVRISIDDFGTGFTSLALLPTLPLDELKVDQSFVLRSVASRADEAIVRTVGELAHRLGLQVVAEGVETADTAVLLRAMGIDLLQGYHFARPMPEADLLAFVTDGTRAPSRVPTAMVVPAGRPAPPTEPSGSSGPAPLSAPADPAPADRPRSAV